MASGTHGASRIGHGLWSSESGTAWSESGTSGVEPGSLGVAGRASEAINAETCGGRCRRWGAETLAIDRFIR